MAARSETIAMRAGEKIATEALAEYLRDRLEGAEHGIALEQFPNWHSNLTYLLRTEAREYVLRMEKTTGSSLLKNLKCGD